MIMKIMKIMKIMMTEKITMIMIMNDVVINTVMRIPLLQRVHSSYHNTSVT